MPKTPDRPILCYVTDRKSLPVDDPITSLSHCIERAIHAGITWIQIREKDFPTRELLTLSAEVIAVARKSAQETRTRIILNDRLDVALAAAAGGVHLGHASAPARDVISWCRAGNAPKNFTIGVSCHSLDDVRNAENSGADYVFFGPVFDTPSKRALGTPQGIEQLTAICAVAKIPVIAIGGVDESNAGECLRAGAAGIAAIRFFQGVTDGEILKSKVQKLLQTQSKVSR